MRPIVAAVFFTLMLSAPLVLVGYFFGQRDCQRTEPQLVIGPQGEPGRNGKDGRDGTDCDCAALKAEAVAYVGDLEKRFNALELRLQKLEASRSDLDLLAGRVQFIKDDQRYTLRLLKHDDGSRQWAWESQQPKPAESPLEARIKKLEANQCKCKCR